MDEETRWVTTTEARDDFRQVLNRVEHDDEHVIVSRYGSPAAVIVPHDWYEEAKAALKAGDHA